MIISMRTMRVAAALYIVTLGIQANGQTFSYDDCVLNGLKGTTGDVASQLVIQTCESKRKVATVKVEAEKDAELGPYEVFLERPIETSTGFRVDSDGTYSVLFENKTTKVITYIKLHERDPDYYSFQAPEVVPARHYKSVLEMISDKNPLPAPPNVPMLKWLWEREHTHPFGYKVNLLPGQMVRLRFESAQSGMYSVVVGYRCRPPKLLDRVTYQSEEAVPFDTLWLD